MDTKRCSKCETFKPLPEFPITSRKKIGVHCKACINAYKKQWRLKNKDKIRSYNKEYVKSNPHKNKEWQRKYADSHREQSRTRARLYAVSGKRTIAQKRYYESHKEQEKQRKQRYYKDHPELLLAQKRRRRVNKLSVVSTFTNKEWKWLLQQCGYRCLCCGNNNKLTQDHVVPLNPGNDTLSNSQVLCKSCNSKKHRNITDYRPFHLKTLCQWIDGKLG